MPEYKRRPKEHDVDGYFSGEREKSYSGDFHTDFSTDIEMPQSEEERVYEQDQLWLQARSNDPEILSRRALFQRGLAMVQRKEEQEKKEAKAIIGKHTTLGLLDETALGSELLEWALMESFTLVDNVLNELGMTDRDDVSHAIVSKANEEKLSAIASSPAGMDLLIRLYDELTSGSIGKDEQESANRVMHIIGNTLPVENYPQQLRHIRIFPHKDSQGVASGPTIMKAKPVGNGKIYVRLSPFVYLGRDFPEAKTLPDSAFLPDGLIVDANETIGIKMYDEGGEILFRPAIFLVQCANKTDAHYMQLLAEAAVAGITLGASAGATRVASGGLTLTQKIVSILDKAATGAYIATRIVQENRGWIIARFGDSGRKFIDYTELVNNAMMIYGGVRLVTSLGKLVANWKSSHKKLKDLVSREQGLDDDQLKIVKKIDDQVEEVVQKLDDLQEEVYLATQGKYSITAYASGYAKLPERLRRIKKLIDESLNKYIIVNSKQISLNDIRILGAVDDVEYALLTRGSQRMIIKGETLFVKMPKPGYELGKEGWRWSGHYHPRGANLNTQDYKLLNEFQRGQKAGGFSIQKETRVMDPNRVYDLNR